MEIKQQKGDEQMSKTNFCENKEQKRYDYVAGKLDGGFRQHNLSTKAVSKKTGIPERTVTDRLKNPEKMPLRDLYKLADAAGVRIAFVDIDVPD